ncbi:hypothetical protein LGM85_28150 [Burkholderia multivorans]|uniref:hypothetical protein n=1 Tax=Burkholderia multivorans TaxID=87883 RepID=UPI0019D25596|nr:hypothetical protein [Burkholderia multivorans]MBN6738846.1 hypothetical protein [Burkholderia multivorans]MBN7130551.1 hypothetical protein [Burkholderia multivorans]MBN8173435.1 hypothetical protein [Burkholderia multivorans]MBU9370987.1 hypothetical protein [Burkholderia multivorans]MBU9439438.1 hypothetical protein [Burkholderia multivorans]
MRKLAITAILSLLSASLSATTLSGGPQSVFMIALENGTATAPLDSNGQYSVAISAIRERTGDNGPVVVLARRIASFKEQPRCGRVAFIVAQPSSHTAWTDMGGELNICDDGNPPLRICAAEPSKLVLPDSACADGSTPVDIPEVADAIKSATAAGGMDPREAARRVRAAATPAGAAETERLK